VTPPREQALRATRKNSALSLFMIILRHEQVRSREIPKAFADFQPQLFC
jgi:hypothetical protein